MPISFSLVFCRLSPFLVVMVVVEPVKACALICTVGSLLVLSRRVMRTCQPTAARLANTRDALQIRTPGDTLHGRLHRETGGSRKRQPPAAHARVIRRTPHPDGL